MNLDDFIVTDNVATPPAGMPFPTPYDSLKQDQERSGHSLTSAIPIKTRKEPAQHFVPQSVPAARVQDEFGYVTRHPRKTSIDERRVRDSCPSCRAFLPVRIVPCGYHSAPPLSSIEAVALY
jgi:GATA-binding protein